MKFEKGKSGNPRGRPRVSSEVKVVRKMTAFEFTRIMNRLMEMTRTELVAFSKDERATSLELMVASILSKAIINGDANRAEFLLSRLIGKVTEVIEVSGPDAGAIDIAIQRKQLKSLMADPEGMAALETIRRRLLASPAQD